MAYNLQGMCIQSENLAGQVTTTARDGSRFDVSEFPSGEASAEGGSMRSASSPSQGEAFTPQFDLDMRPRRRRRVARRSEATEPRSGRKGPRNQTLIKTSTGIWSVTYNGENRPIFWTCTQSNNQTITNNQTISMSFDRMGRRVTKNDQRFIYDGYLQIANFEHQTSNIKLQAFIWDPTEPVATRPLAWLVLRSLGEGGYYTHDGNKNVSEVIAADGDVCAHYEYAPFGAVAVQSGKSASTNPWRFSSEFADDATKTIYYIFRCHEPLEGRWLSRDPIEEHGGQNLFENVGNDPIGRVDRRGLYGNRCSRIVGSIMGNKNGDYAKYKKILDARVRSLREEGKDSSPCSVKVFCDCCRGIRNLRTGGFYQAPAEGKSSGKIVICKNRLGNMNLTDVDYEKKATEILNHEMLHAVQECYSEKFATPCEESICREINSYYNANTGDTSIYRCEKERKDGVWEGVLYSSSFHCAPATAPRVSQKEEERMKKIFERLYEKCKNKWPRNNK